MSLDAIRMIYTAEEEARQEKKRMRQKAAEAIEAVERAGRNAVEAALSRAESEIADLTRTADHKAAEEATQLASSTANKQAALRARAEARYDKAARFILERIVNT